MIVLLKNLNVGYNAMVKKQMEKRLNSLKLSDLVLILLKLDPKIDGAKWYEYKKPGSLAKD